MRIGPADCKDCECAQDICPYLRILATQELVHWGDHFACRVGKSFAEA